LQGNFIHGTIDDVRARVGSDMDGNVAGRTQYVPPTQVLPETPPPLCTIPECKGECSACVNLKKTVVGNPWSTSTKLKLKRTGEVRRKETSPKNGYRREKGAYPRTVYARVDFLGKSLKKPLWMKTATLI